jgi:3-hydroxybutyryl-CoA dehydrogenase
LTTDIRTIAIIGAGTMGRRIAFGCVRRGFATRLFDTSPQALATARAAVTRLIEERRAGGRSPGESLDDAMSHLVLATSLAECVADADLVIESVPEIVDLKRSVFAAIDAAAPSATLIGSNTSSIPASWLADATTRPDKVFDLNFGTPDDLKVELMAHAGTSEQTMQRASDFVRALALVPIRVHVEQVGYAVNRVWRAVKKEVLALLERGAITPEDLDRGWMLDWGTPIGPCGLMDKIGLDVVRDIELIYYRASHDESDRPPPFLERMIAEGKLGEKTGVGFYRYPSPAYLQDGFLEKS